MINADGTRIAFMSCSDPPLSILDPGCDIFLLDTKANTLTRVTNTRYYSGAPSINADGTRIAFLSNADLTGENPDANDEIFLFNATSGTITQITHVTSPPGDPPFYLAPINSYRPSISSDGIHIVFEANADLTGGNQDGDCEIFLVNITTSVMSTFKCRIKTR